MNALDPWDACPAHEWEEIESMFSNEFHADVRCLKCNAPGEQDRKSGEVFWPAT